MSRLHFSGRYKRSDWRLCASAINVKLWMSSETTKNFRYKCHDLFGNSPLVITVKRFLKMSFNATKYNVFLINHCHGLWRTTLTWFTLAIKICLKTCLPRVNLRQIILLRGYIHPNEQAVVFIPQMLCHIAGHWWFYIYCACAETSFGTFIPPEKCKRYNVTCRLRRSCFHCRSPHLTA